jgi:hypothetical protein
VRSAQIDDIPETAFIAIRSLPDKSTQTVDASAPYLEALGIALTLPCLHNIASRTQTVFGSVAGTTTGLMVPGFRQQVLLTDLAADRAHCCMVYTMGCDN